MPLFRQVYPPHAAASPFDWARMRPRSQPWLPDPFGGSATPAVAPPAPTPSQSRRSGFDWTRTVPPSPRPFTYAGYAERMPPAASTTPTPAPEPVLEDEPLEEPMRARPRPLLG